MIQIDKVWLGIGVMVLGLFLFGLSLKIPLQTWKEGWQQPNSKLIYPDLLPDPTSRVTPSTPTPTPTPNPVTLLFVGDLMFDRNIRIAAQKSGNDFIFAPIATILKNQQLVVANLEGPITNFPSKSVGSAIGSPANYIFTFDPSLAETLKQHQISLVDLGNNHILNFGQAGLDQTLEFLKTAQVQYFGQIGPTQDFKSLPLAQIIELNQQKIAFISYNQFSTGQPETVIETEISTLKLQADWVIVLAHWDREYEPVALPATVKLAHRFIDAGADLVIGSHPHVIQNHEIYQGREIYYSLGNFVFDQYFEPAVKKGMMVSVKLYPQPKILDTTPMLIQLQTNGQTSLEK